MSDQMKNIQILREETGGGIMEVKKVLEKADGDLDKARTALQSMIDAKAAKKADRTAEDGLVYSYIHGNGKLGSMILLSSETDFAAKNETFQELCKEIALQVCTEEYESVDALLEAEYMRDPSKKIGDLIKEAAAKLGEKIVLRKFARYSTADAE